MKVWLFLVITLESDVFTHGSVREKKNAALLFHCVRRPTPNDTLGSTESNSPHIHPLLSNSP